jgi:hypothetical protein
MDDWRDRQVNRQPVLLTVILCLLASGLYYHFFFNRAQVELSIDVEYPSDFKLYWSAENQPFSEKRRAVVRVKPGHTDYSFGLTDIGTVAQLRLDPVDYVGEALVRSLVISQRGYETITFDLAQAMPLNDIDKFSVDETGLLVQSSGQDANFLILPVTVQRPVNWGMEAIRHLLIWLAIICVVRACVPLQHNYGYVPLMLAMVFILVVSMAALSKRNAHPDEYVHLDATAYYQKNWLPPEVDDPAIEHTYSPYGISRLNNGEVYYLLAGKFASLVSIFKMDTLFGLRLFNVAMFGCIVLYAIGSLPARLVAAPFLISPQVWYIFSYCGSDAFGLFLSFLAGCEIVRPNSYLNRILDGQSKCGVVSAGLFISILLGLMLLLKINYYPFIALAGAYVLYQLFVHGEQETRLQVFSRLALIALVAVLLAGGRLGADYFVNGLDRQEKMAAMQEKTAHHWFKPSTELDKKHVTMYLKQRGTTLRGLVQTHQWFEHTFVSGFGLYGYFTIAAPERYYRLVKWVASIFLIYIFAVVLIRGSTETRLLALFVLGLGIALIAASLHRSWTVDFQPQGRYLFPILPMLGVLLARSRSLFANSIFAVLLSALFFLSLYSFIFIALVSIPRPA